MNRRSVLKRMGIGITTATFASQVGGACIDCADCYYPSQASGCRDVPEGEPCPDSCCFCTRA